MDAAGAPWPSLPGSVGLSGSLQVPRRSRSEALTRRSRMGVPGTGAQLPMTMAPNDEDGDGLPQSDSDLRAAAVARNSMPARQCSAGRGSPSFCGP